MSVSMPSQPFRLLYLRAEGKESLLPLYLVVLIPTASSHKTYLCHEVIYKSIKLSVRPSCVMKWKMFSLLATLADSTIVYIYFSLCQVFCFLEAVQCFSSRLHVVDIPTNHLRVQGCAVVTCPVVLKLLPLLPRKSSCSFLRSLSGLVLPRRLSLRVHANLFPLSASL